MNIKTLLLIAPLVAIIGCGSPAPVVQPSKETASAATDHTIKAATDTITNNPNIPADKKADIIAQMKNSQQAAMSRRP
jgi:predicted small lipoprotein YifL